jgi:transcriptional regulator with XRE-family HTH domain
MVISGSMPVSTEELRALLSRPLTGDVAPALKEWRAHCGFSQAEAAIHLGVSLRTLQGWEAGRPMPYPTLLQRTVDITARARDQFGLTQSQFPREFAAFIDFLGAPDIDKALRKICRKLDGLSPSVRPLFGDRFYFHEQWGRFTEGPTAFHLDLTDLRAVRAATLIAGINRIRGTLSPRGQARLRAMVLSNLQPDRDVRQIEHEIRCYTHFARKRFRVTFADLEDLGRFDLLIETPAASTEVECKTVTEDTGSQIKVDLNVHLSEAFRRAVLRRPPVNESGLFVLTFKKPTTACKDAAQQLKNALSSEYSTAFEGKDFSLQFVAKPNWQTLFDSGQIYDLQRQIVSDPALAGNAHCVVKAQDRLLGLALLPHKSATLGQRVVDVIKEAANQCSGQKSCVVWLHFVGLAEREFLTLAELSSGGEGAGLNAVVAKALHPKASTTDRTHVERVRFSASPDALSRHAALGPTLLLSQAVSVGGATYDVANPFCRLPRILDF